MKNKITLLMSICTFYLSAQNLIFDNSYATNGISILDNETGNSGLKSIIQPDGKMIFAGTRINGANLNESFVARLNENGSVDTTFGSNGYFTSNQDLSYPSNLYMVGNKILIYYSSTRKLIKLNNNGTLDNTFGINGILNVVANGSFTIENATLIDNNLYIRSSDNDSYNLLQKVDVSIGNIISTTNVLGISYIKDVYKGPNNKLLLKSFDGQNSLLFLVNTDGTIDTSFGVNGSIVVSTFTSINAYENTTEYIVLDNDNNIIYTQVDFNTFTTTVKKYNQNGSLTTTFGNSGSFQISNSIMSDVKTFSNEIYLSGASLSNNNATLNLLVAKLTSNGVLDNNFNNNGVFIYSNNSYEELSKSFNILSATSFLVAGQIRFSSNNKSIFTAKLNLTQNLSNENFDIKNSIFFENPIKSNLTFNSTEKINKIKLYSASGQQIKTILENNENVSELKNGIYLAKIEFENGKIKTEKLIKN